jgi:hypothetical protein
MPAPVPEPREKESQTFRVESSGSGLALAPDGKTLACGLVLRELAAGKELARGEVAQGHPPCTYVAFSPDGKRLASVHYYWGLDGACHAICLSNVTPDNKLHRAATLSITKGTVADYGYWKSLHYLTFSPDGRMLATRHAGEATVVWETASGKERLRLETHGLVVGFAPDGRTLISVSRDGLVQHWDLATKKCIDPTDGAWREDFLFVRNAVASADGKTLAIADGYSVLLKDAGSGKTLRRFDGLGEGDMELSLQGKTLAVASIRGVVLLDADTGKELARPLAADRWVAGVALSPDAKSLVVASSVESVSIWEVGKLVSAEKKAVKADPPSRLLEARLTSRKDAYRLALSGKTPEEIARQFDGVRSPDLPPPDVDLVLTIRNTSDATLALEPDVMYSLHITGDGAMNPDSLPNISQTACDESDYHPAPKYKVTLAPGETYSVPINSLRGSCWLLPGEYTLRATAEAVITPAPEGTYKSPDGSGRVTLTVPPLPVKVVAEK